MADEDKPINRATVVQGVLLWAAICHPCEEVIGLAVTPAKANEMREGHRCKTKIAG